MVSDLPEAMVMTFEADDIGYNWFGVSLRIL
jgi:hypothetical protein